MADTENELQEPAQDTEPQEAEAAADELSDGDQNATAADPAAEETEGVELAPVPEEVEPAPSITASRAGSAAGSRPAGSRAGSAAGSRAGSAAGSRAGSRAGSVAGSVAGSRRASMASVVEEPNPLDLLKIAAPPDRPRKLVKSSQLQLADLKRMIDQLSEEDRHNPELQPLIDELSAIKMEEANQVSALLDLRSRLFQSAETLGINLEAEPSLQTQVLQLAGSGSGSRPSSRGSRAGGGGAPTEEMRRLAEKSVEQLAEIKRLSEQNRELSQKVHETETLLHQCLSEANTKLFESSQHDRLVRQLHSENAQLALSLQRAAEERRTHERNFLVTLEKHQALVAAFRALATARADI